MPGIFLDACIFLFGRVIFFSLSLSLPLLRFKIDVTGFNAEFYMHHDGIKPIYWNNISFLIALIPSSCHSFIVNVNRFVRLWMKFIFVFLFCLYVDVMAKCYHHIQMKFSSQNTQHERTKRKRNRSYDKLWTYFSRWKGKNVYIAIFTNWQQIGIKIWRWFVGILNAKSQHIHKYIESMLCNRE